MNETGVGSLISKPSSLQSTFQEYETVSNNMKVYTGFTIFFFLQVLSDYTNCTVIAILTQNVETR